MLILAENSLRRWLREKTSAAHEKTDALFAELDLASPPGLARFLITHALAAPAMAAAIHDCKSFSFSDNFSPRPVRDLLAADLAALDYATPPPLDFAFPAEDPKRAAFLTGAAYTLAGSRLGARFLGPRLGGLADRAGAYLQHENLFGDWRRFCSELDALGETIERETCLAGARAAFDQYAAAFRQADADGAK